MPSLVHTVLNATCPRCGNGKLFTGFMTVRPACESCGLDLREHDSGDGPAVFLIFILGFLIVPVAVIAAFNSPWPFWLNTLLSALVLLGATLGLLRPAKALTIALQYRHRSTSKRL